MGALKVHSGECCLCDVGIPTGFQDQGGKPLHTGDIVLVYHVQHPGTDNEYWADTGNLSAVVSDQYQSFSGGNVQVNNRNPEPFVMGIKSAGFNDPEWAIVRLKAFSDVVDGEHWTAYGFNYRMNQAADAAWDGTETGDAA